MNIERYIWPVIIAVSFHGALLFSIGKQDPPTKTPVEKPPVLQDIPLIAMIDPPHEESEANAGQADPLPSQVDIPRPADPEDIFTILVTPSATPIKPVLTLPKNFRGTMESEGPGLNIGRPSLPDVGKLDRIPRATVQPAPSYPHTMRSSGTSGSVTVEFVVDTTGRVITADAVRWTHHEFVDPAVRAVLRWRFEPGKLNGRAVSFRMAVPIEFNAER